MQSSFGKKSGSATINEFDDASLEKCVRRAEELAQLAPENPEFVEPLPAQTYGGESKTFSFTIKPLDQLTFPNKHGEQLLEDGYFTVMVGNLKTKFQLKRK